MYLQFVSVFAAGISKLFITILARTPVRSRFTSQATFSATVKCYTALTTDF